ncbi:hypothetical protein KIH87_09840 [Paraneptunicella aestuarii]|uniref:hypothetical protein n=1 Tax=Paraneptunicella aestuarii TaxID=2831148 RepID=UPI001E289568|nr:hypothetical protein [Paraneptunicella aestuarii]UAA40612.1 hypothetical protein KIH87_09840 [Paraneptunicella aestuarii]
MSTGEHLIDEILKNDKLMSIDNCPGVPVNIGLAVYGSVQDDKGGVVIEPTDKDLSSAINKAIGFSGANSETSVWHFQIGKPTHHFVVIPWYRHSTPDYGQVYTVFMAWENAYTVQQYVNGSDPAPDIGGTGFKHVWTVSELNKMLTDLMTKDSAWEDYFGQVGQSRASKLEYWKYKTMSIDKAVSNVTAFSD